jgi:hypothetical protein
MIGRTDKEDDWWISGPPGDLGGHSEGQQESHLQCTEGKVWETKRICGICASRPQRFSIMGTIISSMLIRIQRFSEYGVPDQHLNRTSTSVGDPDPQDPLVLTLPDPDPLVRGTDPDPSFFS